MADNIEIIIGADAGQLQAELTAATNELRKLEAQLKKSTDVQEITKLTTSIRYVKEAITGLNAESKALSGSLGKLPATSNQASQSLLNLSRIAQDAPFGFMGIANNINPLVESFGRLKKESGSTQVALQQLVAGLNGPAGLGLAIGIGTALLTVFSKQLGEITGGLFGASKAAEDLKKQKEELNKVTNQAYSDSAKEATQVLSMIAVLKSETETRQRKLDALKELNRINPEIFGGLKLEKDLVNDLDAAYKAYIQNQRAVIAVKLLQAEVDKKIEEGLKLEGLLLTEQEKKVKKASKTLEKYNENLGGAAGMGKKKLDFSQFNKILSDEEKVLQDKKDANNKIIQEYVAKLEELSQGIKVPVSQATKVKVEKPKKVEVPFNWEAEIYKLLHSQEGVEIAPQEIGVEIIIKPKTDQMMPGLLQASINDYVDKIKKLKLPKALIPFQLFPTASFDQLDYVSGVTGAVNQKLKDFYDKYNKLFADAAESAKKAQGEIIMGFSTDTIALFASSLGTAIAGGTDSIRNAFQGLFGLIGDGLIQLGKYAILYSSAIIKLKEALAAGSGITGIGIGIGLILLGTLIKTAVSGIGKASKFAVGTRYAPGGMALVGERGPELINLPRGSQVIPTAQTSNMMGGLQAIQVYGVLRGQDIYFSNKKYGQTYNRTT